MKIQAKGKTAASRSLCLTFGEGDGVDPKYAKRETAAKPVCYKQKQLCKQAGRMINLVLSEQVNRPLLNDLQVVSVVPEQNGRVLKITVAHAFVNLRVTDAEIIAELKQLQGLMRSALAHSVNRKQTPQLTFNYAGCLGEGAGHAD